MKKPLSILVFFSCFLLQAQVPVLEDYNPVWTIQSKNSSESMPVGGGDIGLNAWVENGEVYFYFSRSGTFDEHNTFLKLGRVKLSLEPNPFKGNEGFQQELKLKDGHLRIVQNDTEIKLWIDVFNPVIHVDIDSKTPLKVTAAYENWRHRNRKVEGSANNANSYKWNPPKEIITYKDSVDFRYKGIEFFHSNRDTTVFDVAVKQQKMESVKDQMMNPIGNLTFGGMMLGENMQPGQIYKATYQNTDFKGFELVTQKPVKRQNLQIHLHTKQTEDISIWRAGLNKQIADYKNSKIQAKKSKEWWNNFWERSFIFTENSNKPAQDSVFQIGRNYQLFRYMLGANAYGEYPTKFNGGLFTYDPVFVKSDMKHTPDFRNWGGGTMTAQNQRLVYLPMLKSGDFDMMQPQFDFYLRSLKNAELRSKVYWGHGGASFTEQLENFGLPNPTEYGWDRPENYDPGMQYNAWLEHQWDTVFEICLMMLEQERYAAKNISEFIPLIESCLQFFDEHYQYLAKNRGAKVFDENGHLVLYPGSSNETYKMAYNATSTVSALKVITERMLALDKSYVNGDQRKYIQELQERIPDLSFREIGGKEVIAPAKLWERINNTEVPQLYPVYPWGIFGIGRPDLQTAINTWKYDPDALEFRSHKGWKQDNIFAARMGLTEEAAHFTLKKMADSERRFPAFWGPGFDWVPDHNWGGSGMIGMQEMLMQTNADEIYLFPAWPKEWDVHFKLHAPKQTIIEAKLINGTVEILDVEPSSRRKDIINMINFSVEDKIQFNEKNR